MDVGVIGEGRPSSKPSPESEVVRLRQEGNLHFHSGELEKALSSYDSALALAPPPLIQSQLHLNKAVVYEKKQDWDKVVEECTKATELTTINILALCRRYDALMNLGKWDEALSDITLIAMMDFPECGYYLGRVEYTVLKASLREAEDLMKNKKISPRSGFAIQAYMKTFFNDSIASWWSGKFPPGFLPLSAGDNNAESKGFLKAVQELSSNKFESLIDLCTEELNGSDSKFVNEAHLLRGAFRSLWGYGKEDVLEDLNFVLNSTSASNELKVCALNKLGELHSFDENKEEMRRVFEEGKKLSPDNVDVYIQYGNSLLESEDYDEALEQVNKALEIQPDLLLALGIQKFLEYRIKSKQDDGSGIAESVLDFCRLVERFPTSAELFMTLGHIYKEIQEPCGAYFQFLKGAELEPTNTQYRIHSIMAYFEITGCGGAQKCIGELETILKLDERASFAYEALATIQINLGLIDAALETIEKGLGFAKARHEFLSLAMLKTSAGVRAKQSLFLAKYRAESGEKENQIGESFEQLTI